MNLVTLVTGAFDTFAYIGTQEILLIAGVALLLFGGAKLPELAKGLGQGIREFKRAVDHDTPEPKEPVVPVEPNPAVAPVPVTVMTKTEAP